MKTLFSSFRAAPLIALSACSLATAAEPGDYWLTRYGFHAYEWDWDHDGDGHTAWEEYFFGTNPLNSNSAPPVLNPQINAGTVSVAWPSRLGARYGIGRSPNLLSWAPVSSFLSGTGAMMSASFAQSGAAEFFRLEAHEPLDADGDGLSAVEEGILGTNAAAADTDGDSLNDGTEIFQTFTDPLVMNPTGGTIRGSVKTDPNGDGNPTDGSAIQGADVFLDLNYDGELTSGEPLLQTNASGIYEFTHLAPGVYHVRQTLVVGQFQTLPAPAASPVLDRLPDEVVSYTHGVGGEFPSAYGIPADTSVVVPVIAFRSNQLLDPAITLKPIGRRGLLPPVAVWSYNEYLSIPETGSILWRFDEKIINKPGTDLIIHVITQGVNEQATLQLGLTPGTLQNAGTITEQQGATTTAIPIDLETAGVTGAVQYVKITSITSQGASAGFDIVGAEAVNFAPPLAGAIEVVVAGSETHENKNFARQFRDDPPEVFLFVNGADFRAGQTAPVTVQAQDDIGITARTLTANGAAVSLNGDGEGTVSLPAAGTVELIASVTDTGGHTTTEEATIYVLNADGSSPFNANLTGAGTAGSLDVEIVTPHSGAILNANTPVTARISGFVSPNWVLDYAPVGLIDPYNMAAADPDWITLGSGSGFLTNQSAGTLPVATLPNGIYFLRLGATPTGGGTTVYRGQVFAKGVNAEDIQPRVTITSPAQGSTAGILLPIIGSITSSRPLVEWYAEYAPAGEVDLNDLGSNEPPWKRFAQGTTTISNALIGNLDTSLIPDGSYVVRIVAWNDIRLGWAEPLPIEIAGTVKLGRLRREFTDLKLPVGGIPFVIRRVYDSLDAERDQGLGYGWSLAMLNPDIKETVADTGSGIFGNTPFREGTRVYVNTPDGRRAGFTFHAEFGVGGLLGAIYKAEFIPDPGVYEKLAVPEGDQPFLSIDGDGNAFISFLGTAWNPSVYILTTRDGVKYTYDEDAGFIAAEDRNGNTLAVTPDGLRHSSGNAVTFTRDGNNRITQINAPGGITIQYGYDAAGNLITVTDDDGRVTELGYYTTPAHFLKDVTDPLGRVGVTYEFDGSGRLVAIVDENGQRTEQSLNPGAFTGAITDRNGHVTSFVYNSRGNVTQETNALGQVTAYAYGDPANPDKETSMTDAREHTTTYTYDAFGNNTVTNRPLDSKVSTFDADGRRLSHRDFDGAASAYTYDAKGNLASASEPGHPSRTYSYSPEGLLVGSQVDDTAGSGRILTSTAHYDSTGNLTRLENDHLFSMDLVVAANGDIESVTMPGGRTQSFQYDASGRPVEETDAAGNTIHHTVLPNGTVRSVDRLGRTTDHLAASDQTIELITLPNGSTITPTYDDERNLTSVADAAGNLWQYQYDALNRPVRITDPTGAFSTMAYDAVGNVVERVNRNGKRRTFVFDASNRLTHERWHDGTGAVIREFVYSYHFTGYLSQVTDGGHIWTFLGALPRPGGVITAYAGQTARTVSYAWGGNAVPGPGGGCCGSEEADAGSAAPTEIQVSGGADFFGMKATYDGPDLIRLQWSSPGNFFGPDLQFIRGSDGLLSEIKRYSGTLRSRSTFTWDLQGRLSGYSHLDGSGAPLHADAPTTYTRDAESRITGITRAGDAAVYSYDLLDQLTGATHTGGPAESYTYNAMGVRTASHRNAGPSTVGAANRLQTAGTLTFTYDAEGNVSEKTNTTTGQVTRYSYDHRNQLVLATLHPNSAAPAATTVSFEYDFEGRMMSRTLDGAKTWILYDREMPVAEFADGSNAVNAAFLYAPNRLDDFHGVWRSGVGDRLLLKDHLGTVVGATDTNGVLQYWASFDAFGNVIGSPPSGQDAIRFTGRFFNQALGLYEMRARFYDPDLGRFIQEDPRHVAGNDLNLYRYVGNNPLTFTDPTGEVAAIEYMVIINQMVTFDAYCDLAKCVGQLWGGLGTALLGYYSPPPKRACGASLLGGNGTGSGSSRYIGSYGLMHEIEKKLRKCNK